MEYQLILEIRRTRLTESIFGQSLSRHLLIFAEGAYRHRIVRSAECSLTEGLQLTLPWSERLRDIRFALYLIDERLRIFLGSAEYHIPTTSGFYTDGRVNDVVLDILPSSGNCEMNCGRMLCSVWVQRLYGDGRLQSEEPKMKEKSKEKLFQTLPGFRFRRLSKNVHWAKLRGLDPDHIAETTDLRTLLTVVDDVALGDAAEEDCDPRILRALQVAQFTTQYLLSSRKVLEEKRRTIQRALGAFEEEEETLDLKIAKMKAKTKAMRREMREMERVSDSYERTLATLDPTIWKRMNNCRREIRRQLQNQGGGSDVDEDAVEWGNFDDNPSKHTKDTGRRAVITRGSRPKTRHEPLLHVDSMEWGRDHVEKQDDQTTSKRPSSERKQQQRERVQTDESDESESPSWNKSAKPVQKSSVVVPPVTAHDPWRNANSSSQPSVNDGWYRASDKNKPTDIPASQFVEEIVEEQVEESPFEIVRPKPRPILASKWSRTSSDGPGVVSARTSPPTTLTTAAAVTTTTSVSSEVWKNASNISDTATGNFSVDSLAGPAGAMGLQRLDKSLPLSRTGGDWDQAYTSTGADRLSQTAPISRSGVAADFGLTASSIGTGSIYDHMPRYGRENIVSDDDTDSRLEDSVRSHSLSESRFSDSQYMESQESTGASDVYRRSSQSEDDQSVLQPPRETALSIDVSAQFNDTAPPSVRTSGILKTADGMNSARRSLADGVSFAETNTVYGISDFDDSCVSEIRLESHRDNGSFSPIDGSVGGVATPIDSGAPSVSSNQDQLSIDRSESVVLDFSSSLGIFSPVYSLPQSEPEQHRSYSSGRNPFSDESSADGSNLYDGDQNESFSSSFHRLNGSDGDMVMMGTMPVGLSRQFSDTGVVSEFDRDSLAGTAVVTEGLVLPSVSEEGEESPLPLQIRQSEASPTYPSIQQSKDDTLTVAESHDSASVESLYKSDFESAAGTPIRPSVDTAVFAMSTEESLNDESRENMNGNTDEVSIEIAEPTNTEMTNGWHPGRAAMEDLELAKAIELHISAIRLENPVPGGAVRIAAEFLDIRSDQSEPVTLHSDNPFQSISYYTHMKLGSDEIDSLGAEMLQLGDSIPLTVTIFSDNSDEIIAQAVIEIWSMIQHNCPLLRSEALLFTPSLSDVMGSIVVDVRGYQILTKTAKELELI